MSTEQSFSDMAKSSVHGSVFPKLQVVKKDGFYFTLNDAKLQIYRHLEKLGKCGSVEVERIALKEVPEGIRNLMKAPERVRRCTGGFKHALIMFIKSVFVYKTQVFSKLFKQNKYTSFC